jgi:hypothetical protein
MTLVATIAAALISLGFGTALGTDIFAYQWPAGKTGYLIIPLAGRMPSEEMGGAGIDYPGIQIQTKHASMATAEANAEAVRLALNGITQGGYTIFTTRSHAVHISAPEDIEAGYYRFSVDFETISAR